MPKKEVEKNSKGKNTKAIEKDKNKAVVKKSVSKNVEVIDNVTPKVEKKGKCMCKLTNNTPFMISICVIVILLAALIYCGFSRRIPKVKNSDEVIATLKGKKITAQDLYQELKEENGTNALINAVDEYIASKEVKITKDDEKYAQEVVDYYKEYANYYNTDLKTFLANYVGLSNISTEKEFYDFVLKDYKKTLAVQKFIGDKASEDDLKKYYKENFSDKLTVKHILIQVDSDAEDKDKADKDAYNKAVELINTLKKTDSKKLEKKFETLAKENSDDTETYSNGGLIEDFSKKDVVEEFYNAANKLKDGEYTTKPVKTTYGYHIILKISSTPVEKYNDIKDQVKTEYAKSLLNADSTLQVSEWDKLRSEYKLSIKDSEVKKAYEKTIKDALKTDNSKDSKDTESDSKK
mgnify:FL=1